MDNWERDDTKPQTLGDNKEMVALSTQTGQDVVYVSTEMSHCDPQTFIMIMC